MWPAVLYADALVRGTEKPAERPDGWESLRSLVGLVCLGGMAYGAVMGSFGGWGGERIWQLVYSAVKVPLLLLGTFAVCLPSYFVLNTVAGLRSDFGEVLRGLLAAQAGLTLGLSALAPFTCVWYLSTGNYHAAILFNALVFGLASLAAQSTLRRRYSRLIRRNGRHRLLLRFWLVLYLFVGIQMGWLLRPFVGQPGVATQWFRADMWGNAYVELLHHMTSAWSVWWR